MALVSMLTRVEARRFGRPHGRIPRKTCSSCGDYKLVSEFQRRRAWCRGCAGAYYTRRYRTMNGLNWPKPGKAKKYTPEVRRRVREINRGISTEQYNDMFAAQSGLCGICGQPETKTRRDGSLFELALDHCHRTGAKRGLLCTRCNTAIGLLKDDPIRLQQAGEYLARAKGVQANV